MQLCNHLPLCPEVLHFIDKHAAMAAMFVGAVLFRIYLFLYQSIVFGCGGAGLLCRELFLPEIVGFAPPS